MLIVCKIFSQISNAYLVSLTSHSEQFCYVLVI